MPVTLFEVRWPDQSLETCYSPSSVVKESFSEGSVYPLAQFVALAEQSLQRASRRVAEKYGSPCSQAMGQLARIKERAVTFENLADPQVELIRFLKG
jgi:uncharacterized repeat protein (TIGR04042 family)